MKRLIVATFVALAMTVFVNAHAAFSQEDPVSGSSVDADWASPASTIDSPVIDESAASADKVLEIPRTACTKDGATVPCDDTAMRTPTTPTIRPSMLRMPGAPPQVYDDDTASAGSRSGLGRRQRLSEPAGVCGSGSVSRVWLSLRGNRRAIESAVAGSRFRVCADEQPHYPGRAPTAESGPVDEYGDDVYIRPSRWQSNDGDGVESVRISSLTASREPFLLHRVRALLSVPDSRRYRRRPSDGDLSC